MINRQTLIEVLQEYGGIKCQFAKLLEIYNVSPMMISSKECGDNFEHIHHIDRDKKNNSVDNLIPLCAIHHDFIHHGIPYGEKHWYHIRTGEIRKSRNPRYW